MREVVGLASIRRAVVVTVGMSTLLGLLVCLYGTSVTSLRPRELPVVAAGPPQAARALADQVADMSPGTLRIDVVPDVAAAEDALRERRAYAAFAISDDGLSLLLASGASPAVAEALTRGLTIVMPGVQIPIIDVVPNVAADQMGGGLAAAYLPLVLVAAAAGVLLARLVRSDPIRFAALAVFAVAAGLAGAVALGGVLDVLPDELWTTAAVLALLSLAAAGTVLGFGAIGGVPGLVVGAATMVVGGALSAASSAPEMLSRPWGEIGQLLPPGAGITLLRSAVYFDGAGGGTAAAVLAGWAFAGVALALLAIRMVAPAGRVGLPTDAPTPTPPAGVQPAAHPSVPAGRSPLDVPDVRWAPRLPPDGRSAATDADTQPVGPAAGPPWPAGAARGAAGGAPSGAVRVVSGDPRADDADGAG